MAKVKDLKVNEPTQRLRGTLPKIGIRPAIDGRRKGVRESLENQTMEMAKSAAKFLDEHLRHLWSRVRQEAVGVGLALPSPSEAVRARPGDGKPSPYGSPD